MNFCQVGEDGVFEDWLYIEKKKINHTRVIMLS